MVRRAGSDAGGTPARGLSPVIGVILLIGIVVAASAAVTTMVIGFGSGTEDNVRATLNLRYDPATQGAEVTLMDRKDADYVEVRYIVNDGADELRAALYDPGSRVRAQTGNATLITLGRTAVKDPDRRLVAAPADEDPGDDGGSGSGDDGARGGGGARGGDGDDGEAGRGRPADAGPPSFDRPLMEGDVVRVMAIAHRGDASTVLVDREFVLD